VTPAASCTFLGRPRRWGAAGWTGSLPRCGFSLSTDTLSSLFPIRMRKVFSPGSSTSYGPAYGGVSWPVGVAPGSAEAGGGGVS
jgi:hypothetical protein